MKPNLMILAICCLMAISCKEKPASTPAEQPAFETPDQEISFLPVADLIREDIRKVDSFAAGIIRKQEGIKKDSAYIKPDQFHQLAEQFLLPELDSSTFKKSFTQSSFMDETSGLLHFIYEAKEASNPLRKVVVYIKPSLNVDKVERIYMERETKENNTPVQQKLTWVMQKYFYTLSIKHPEKGEPVTTVDKVIWDPQAYAD